MRAAVDLDHLPEPRPAFARLKHAFVAHGLRFPQGQLDLHLPDRLARNGDAFAFPQLFRRQSRSKIHVFATQQSLNPRLRRRIHPAWGHPSPLLRNKPRVAVLPPRPHQPLDLTNRHPKPFRSLPLIQFPRHDQPHHMRPLALHRRHPNNIRAHPHTLSAVGQKGDILTLQKGDILALR